MSKEISFCRICPDCMKSRHIITHHIITMPMVKYLVVNHHYDKSSLMNLRNQLTIEVCKDCERKFHKEGEQK